MLVVEDNFLAALLIELTLKEAGYRVIATVRTGEQAIEYAVEHHPELVLMDVNLAGDLDGVQAAERIHLVAGASLSAAVDATEELEETAKLSLLLHGRKLRTLTPAQAKEVSKAFAPS